MSDEPQKYNYTFYMIHRKGRSIIDIYDEEDGEHYIGSTRHFKNRCGGHKGTCNNPNSKDYNIPVYQHIRLNGGFDEWEFSVIEKHDNLTKKDAFIHESWLQELYGSKLNSYRAIATQEETEETRKIWRKNNRDAENSKSKSYYARNAEKCREISRKCHHNNRDKRLEYSRQYWINKKDKINERRAQNQDKINELQRIRRSTQTREQLDKTNKYQNERRYAKKKLEKEQEQNVFATQDIV